MRTNKIIPFFLALSLHVIPLAYFLIKKPAPPALVVTNVSGNPSTPKGIDLSAFSISQKARPTKNSIKSVGLSLSVGSGSGIGNSTDLSAGSTQGFNNSQTSTGPTFTNFKEPPYPPIAREKGYEGKVKIKAYYDQEGSITRVDIVESSGIKMLDEAVKITAVNWKISSTSAGNFEKTFDFRLKN
jgi:protein TonB